MWVLDPRTNLIVERIVRTDGEITFWNNGLHFRTEYFPHDTRYGSINYYLDERLIRTEYDTFHPEHLNVHTYFSDGTEEIEMGGNDEASGSIELWKNGELVSIYYAPFHICHGEVETWKDNRHVCTEYTQVHANYGQVDYYDDYGIHIVRTTYKNFHSEHGRVDYLNSNGSIARIEYSNPHHRSGSTYLFTAEEVRITFALNHAKRGQTIFFTREGEYVKTTYGLDDELCDVF